MATPKLNAWVPSWRWLLDSSLRAGRERPENPTQREITLPAEGSTTTRAWCAPGTAEHEAAAPPDAAAPPGLPPPQAAATAPSDSAKTAAATGRRRAREDHR